MTPLGEGGSSPILVDTDEGLRALARRIEGVDRLALDTEGNGLHAFRERLCAVQLAWREGDTIEVAVVDPFTVDLAPLGATLGVDGPLKVLHDLVFDARILADHGLALARVADTAIAARLLDFAQTGLAALLLELVGARVDKSLQQHDWSKRPLGARELGYLDGDVRHLLGLHDALGERAARLGIEAELAFECEHRLASATTPDRRAAWERLRGSDGLDEPSRRVLRRVVEERERIAEELDRPIGRVLSNDGVLTLARRRALDPRALAASRATPFSPRFRAAIERGLADPPDAEAPRPPPVDRDRVARQRRARAMLLAWRKREAEARAVDEQVVLPGHGVDALARVLADEGAPLEARQAAIAALSGLGSARLDRYADAWLELGARLGSEGPATSDERST